MDGWGKFSRSGGAAAGLGLAPDLWKNLGFDFSWSKNLGGGRRGAGECPRFCARVQISAEPVFKRTLCLCQIKVNQFPALVPRICPGYRTGVFRYKNRSVFSGGPASRG